MIAAQADHRAPHFVLKVDQEGNNAAAVRSAVDVIADKHVSGRLIATMLRATIEQPQKLL